MVEITNSVSFKFLRMTVIFAILPKMQFWFWFTNFLGRNNSSGFQLIFHNIVAFISQVRERPGGSVPTWLFVCLFNFLKNSFSNSSCF